MGSEAATPVFIGLEGALGVGKSVLARSIGRGAGVLDPMPSPSYNLLFRYRGRPGRAIVHLDLYRLAGPDELVELGWDELGGPGEIVLVEWPERAGGALPANRWTVRLAAVEGRRHLRTVSVEHHGNVPTLPAPAPLGEGSSHRF